MNPCDALAGDSRVAPKSTADQNLAIRQDRDDDHGTVGAGSSFETLIQTAGSVQSNDSISVGSLVEGIEIAANKNLAVRLNRQNPHGLVGPACPKTLIETVRTVHAADTIGHPAVDTMKIAANQELPIRQSSERANDLARPAVL